VRVSPVTYTDDTYQPSNLQRSLSNAHVACSTRSNAESLFFCGTPTPTPGLENLGLKTPTPALKNLGPNSQTILGLSYDNLRNYDNLMRTGEFTDIYDSLKTYL